MAMSWRFPYGSVKLKGQHCPVNPSRTRLPLIDCFEAELDFQGVLTSDSLIQITFPQSSLNFPCCVPCFVLFLFGFNISCINQGPWFASLHICPPHFKAMQDLFVSVDESPWMWDTEKHVNYTQAEDSRLSSGIAFFFWRVVQFIDVVAVFCCCLRCSGHSFGMGERLKMLDQRHARALLSRVACIPPDSKLRRCSKRSHWKPVKTAADSGCLLSGLRTGSLMTRLWPKTYLNGACTTLPLLAARKSEKVWLMPDWRKTWSDSRLAWLCRLIPLVKNSNFQFKSIILILSCDFEVCCPLLVEMLGYILWWFVVKNNK